MCCRCMFYVPLDRDGVVGSYCPTLLWFCTVHPIRLQWTPLNKYSRAFISQLQYTACLLRHAVRNFTTHVPWVNEMACCVSSSLERQLWKLLTLTTQPSKRTAVVCLVFIFFSTFFLFCFWLGKIMRTLLRSCSCETLFCQYIVSYCFNNC